MSQGLHRIGLASYMSAHGSRSRKDREVLTPRGKLSATKQSGSMERQRAESGSGTEQVAKRDAFSSSQGVCMVRKLQAISLNLLNMHLTSCRRTGKKRMGEERTGGKEGWRKGGKRGEEEKETWKELAPPPVTAVFCPQTGWLFKIRELQSWPLFLPCRPADPTLGPP